MTDRRRAFASRSSHPLLRRAWGTRCDGDELLQLADVLRNHVVLKYETIDRTYLNVPHSDMVA